MNTRHHRQAVLLAAALLLTSTAATARETPRALYANELARCVEIVRADLQEPGTRHLRHTVTDVRTHGFWHEFDIQSEAFYEVGGEAIRAQNFSCRAHRWNDETKIQY